MRGRGQEGEEGRGWGRERTTVEGRKGERKREGERGGRKRVGGRQEVKVNVRISMFVHCGDMGNSTSTCVRQQFAQVGELNALHCRSLTHTHSKHTH